MVLLYFFVIIGKSSNEINYSERCLKLFQGNKNDFQIGSQLSGQQRLKTVQSDQKFKCQLVRFWPPYFGMRTVFYSSITLRKEEPSIANIIWR